MRNIINAEGNIQRDRHITHVFNLNKIITLEFLFVYFILYESFVHGIGFIILGITGNTVINYLFPISYVIFVILLMIKIVASKFSIIRKITPDAAILALSFLLLYMLSMLSFDNYNTIINQKLFIHTFFECLPAYIIFRLASDHDTIWRYISLGSNILFIIYLIAFFVSNVGSSENYKTFSAGMLIVALVSIINFIKHKINYQFLPFFISSILMLTSGRRTSIVSVIIVTSILCIIEKEFKLLIILLILSLIGIQFYRYLLDFTISLIIKLGVRPRNLLKIANNTFTTDVGRTLMWRRVIKEMLSTPRTAFFGLGIAGDRKLLSDTYFRLVAGYAYPYPHSYIVEILGQFGLVFGSIILITTMFIFPYITLKRISRITSFYSIFIFTLGLFTPLIFQSSYLEYKYYYVYLAIIISTSFKLKVYRKNDYYINTIEIK